MAPISHGKGRTMTRLEQLIHDIAVKECRLTGSLPYESRCRADLIMKWSLGRMYLMLAGYRDAVLDQLDQGRTGQ